jgi:hypothetical protein
VELCLHSHPYIRVFKARRLIKQGGQLHLLTFPARDIRGIRKTGGNINCTDLRRRKHGTSGLHSIYTLHTYRGGRFWLPEAVRTWRTLNRRQCQLWLNRRQSQAPAFRWRDWRKSLKPQSNLCPGRHGNRAEPLRQTAQWFGSDAHAWLQSILSLRTYTHLCTRLVPFLLHSSPPCSAPSRNCQRPARCWAQHIRSWALLEELSVAELLWNSAAFYGNLNDHSDTGPRHEPYESSLTPFNPISIRSTLILSCHLRLCFPNDLFQSGYST